MELKAVKYPAAISEDEALSVLEAGSPEEVKKFSRSFLFIRKNRVKDLEAQIRILRLIANHRYSEPDCVLFSIVAASYKSCDLQSAEHMAEFLAMIPRARDQAQHFKFIDSMRRNRTHMSWSVNSAEAHLLFFLEDSNGLRKHLKSMVAQAKNLDLSELKNCFFLTCAGVSRLLGLALAGAINPKLKPKEISDLIFKVTAVGLMKRAKPVEVHGRLADIKNSNYKHYFEFLGESKICAISQILVEQRNPAFVAALRLELLRACLRTVRNLPDDELNAKAARVFPGWSAEHP